MKTLVKEYNNYEFTKKYFLKSYMRLIRFEYVRNLGIYLEFQRNL